MCTPLIISSVPDIKISFKDLAILLIIIVHLRQLQPQLPRNKDGTPRENWQGGDDFEHDYKRGIRAAHRLVKWFRKAGEKYTAFLGEAEQLLKEECRKLEECLDISPKKHISVVCLCRQEGHASLLAS